MEAQVRRINQILSGTTEYKIPAYQRPYSWEKDEVVQFLTDLYESFTNGDNEYFIGSLIAIEHETNKLFDVVDGQQRLTTLNLIFASFRNAVSDDDANFGLRNIVLRTKPITGKIIGPRLIIRERDHSFFEEHILKGKSISEFEENKIFRLPDVPKKNLIENFKTINEFISETHELDEQKNSRFCGFYIYKS